MSENLNENLYTRFGLQLSKGKVESGFRKHIANIMWDAFYPLEKPDFYDEKFRQLLLEARETVLKACCKELFLDYSDYAPSYGIKEFISDVFEDSNCSLEEFLISIQVILNIFWRHKIIHEELQELAESIQQYAIDFPILGIAVKTYKTKPPQILPSVSKFFNKEMENTLGLLETKKYEDLLDYFEDGLKEFLAARTKAQLKDVVEDMHSACDELIKNITGQKNKGFKHIFKKDECKKLGLNQNQKEIYRNLKDWIDGIKHGSIKQFDREDVEMIISLTASFLRIVINKNITKT